MSPLDPTEIQILRSLRGGPTGWETPAALAVQLDLPTWKVRAVLGEMRRRYLVQRGNTAHGHWGAFSITEHGIVELAGAEQMRLVPLGAGVAHES